MTCTAGSPLRRSPGWCGTLEQLQHAVGSGQEGGALPRGLTLLCALEIWREAALADVEDGGERLKITLRPSQGKADLTATPLWRYLEGRDSDV